MAQIKEIKRQTNLKIYIKTHCFNFNMFTKCLAWKVISEQVFKKWAAWCAIADIFKNARSTFA